MLIKGISILVPCLLGLAACQAGPSSGPAGGIGQQAESYATLTGTVAYRERIALPADAVLVVTISDVSRMDTAAPVVALTEIATAGRQVPIPFSLNYPMARIEAKGRYAVSARIRDGAGRLLWTTDTRFDLPPPGGSIDLPLVRVAR